MTPLLIGYNAVHFLVYNFLQQIKRKKAQKRKLKGVRILKPVEVNAAHFEELLTFLLEKGAKINSINPLTGTTPLHTAVRGCAAHMTYLVDGKKDEDAVAESLKVLRILLRHGALPSLSVADRKRGRTPIHTACQKGTFRVVNLLLSAVPEETERQGDDDTAAASTLTRKRVVNTHDHNGWAPLHISVQKNDTATMTCLLTVQ